MKILFVNPFGIGDVLFTTPLIAPLKEKGHDLYYWCNERVPDILTNNKSITAIFASSRGDLKRAFRESPGKGFKKLARLAAQIRRERFDIALDFSLDYRYSLVLRLLGVRKIAGFNYKGRGRFLTDRIDIDGFEGGHMVRHYAELLKFIDISLLPRKEMELSVGDSEINWAEEFLTRNGVNNNDRLVGIAPGGGTSWGDDAFRKHWPKEKFAYVADRLISDDKCKVLILGSGNESDICDFITNNLKHKAINACGKTTLGQLAALLRVCKLLITNDGGPLHMASALGVSTVSIFGPVNEGVYGPYPRLGKHVVINGDVDCRPCYKSFKYPLCHNIVCLDSIEPAKVIEAARSSLKDKESVVQ